MFSFLDWLREIKNALGLGPEPGVAIQLMINIIIGGLMALFVRALYRRFSNTVSNRDSFSSLFPILTVTVTIVIFVVKSSLALSLGLVGALSIVRFRAAIKEPEELIYLFFCIAIGLALGADFRIVALMGLLGFTFFVVIRDFLSKQSKSRNLLLTVSGDASHFFGDTEGDKVPACISEIADGQEIQRFDCEDGKVQMRIIIAPESDDDIVSLMEKLNTRMPECAVSYVNLNSLL